MIGLNRNGYDEWAVSLVLTDGKVCLGLSNWF